jgi:hypothetical protein
METSKTLWLENAISEYIREDNGCSVHFEYNTSNVDNSLKSIRAITFNPKKNESFLLMEIACSDKESGLLSIWEWVKSHSSNKGCSSFTIIWSKRGEPGTYKSYFYSENARKAINKFFFDKDENEYIVYEVVMNPIS